jgi:pimeloyl-ACP methyl ester carboxylesterase
MNITVPRYQPVIVVQYQERWFWSNPNSLDCSGTFCENTITVTLSGPGISAAETFTANGESRPPSGASPPWALLSNPGGENWGRTVVETINVSGATQSADATLQFSITDVVPQGSYQGSASGTFTAGGSMDILDPVPELIQGNQVLDDPDSLATLGAPVTGIAADGAARVVLRIRAAEPGQSITLALLNDQGAVSSSATADGTLATTAGTPASGQLQLTAVNTLEGPMAFALYEAPTDFDRPGIDDSSGSRTVTFQVTSTSGRPNFVTPPLTIWRPPLVLVHGLWGDPSDWTNFTPIIIQSLFYNSALSVHATDYNIAIAGGISNAMPPYAPFLPPTGNSMGFAYNAPIVLLDIQLSIGNFRSVRRAAATQADVVAHSMGGTIVRAMEYLSGYTASASFGFGNVHKLITIGTPHFGSPLAIQLVQSNNSCIRNLFNLSGRYAISNATVGGVAGVTGGVGDLYGDGANDPSLSPALVGIQTPIAYEAPTAMIAAEMISGGTAPPSNTYNLTCASPCLAAKIHMYCSGPLVGALTSTGWPSVFSGQPSDAIVSFNSQVNGNTTNASPVGGVIHSAGLETIGFTGPGELDSSLGSATAIQTLVIGLLNASVIQNSPFVPLP